MIMHEDSNKFYPSMVACHQVILQCSIIIHYINSFFWNRYILIVEFIKVINFVELIETIIETKLNVLIIWIRKEILVICKRLYKSRKKCAYFYYFPNKLKIFHLLGLCLQGFMENVCTIHPTVIVYMVRDFMA